MELLEPLGHGATTVVHCARRTGVNSSDVAVKMLRDTSADLADAYLANALVDLFRFNRSVYEVRKLWHATHRAGHDVGRPDQVSLIFDRRIVRKGRFATPGRFRTRVITDGVTQSLHVDYKHSRIKQYHKHGRA